MPTAKKLINTFFSFALVMGLLPAAALAFPEGNGSDDPQVAESEEIVVDESSEAQDENEEDGTVQSTVSGTQGGGGAAFGFGFFRE